MTRPVFTYSALAYNYGAAQRLGTPIAASLKSLVAAALPTDNPADPYWQSPHPVEAQDPEATSNLDGADDPEMKSDVVMCFCGQPADSPMHDVPMPMDDPEDQLDGGADEDLEGEAPIGGPAGPGEELLPMSPVPDGAEAEGPAGDAMEPPHAAAGPGPFCEQCGKPLEDPVHASNSDDIAFSADGADTLSEVESGQPFKIPLIVPEGKSSGDGRTFAANSLSSRPTPLALMWQPEGDEGHKGSVIVGRIDHVERTPEGLGNGYGVFDTGKHAQEALRLVQGGMLRGISADLDEFEADVLADDGQSENKITSTKLMVSSGRLMGVTLVAKPAFAECTIELTSEGAPNVADGEYQEDSPETRVAALIASAAPLHPPKSWFENPNLQRPTHLTVEDDGRVFGHIAAWDVDHIGLPFGTRAPRSQSGYAYFRTGVLRTAEGSDVPVGQLTLAGGHAPLRADARAAVKHYDDTASAVADLSAGEDQYGIWVSGALRPGVSPEQVRALRAASPSGDWRPIRGSLELVAVCQVNVPGFPVARAQALVSGGMVQALVAAGAMTLERQDPRVGEDALTLNMRIEALEAAERQRLVERQLSIRERLSPALEAKRVTLTASANAARERVAVRKSELSSQRDDVLARFASLTAAGDFTEGKHPRGEHGRFQQVLARLDKSLTDPSAKDGLSNLKQAADAEGTGDHAKADSSAKSAVASLNKAADAAKDPKVAADLRAAASEVGSVNSKADVPAEKATPDGKPGVPAPAKPGNAVVPPKPGIPGGPAGGKSPGKAAAGEVAYKDLPEMVQELLKAAIETANKVEGKVDPAVQQLEFFIAGKTPFMPPATIETFIKGKIAPPGPFKV